MRGIMPGYKEGSKKGKWMLNETGNHFKSRLYINADLNSVIIIFGYEDL